MSVYSGNEINGLNEYINYGGLPLITTFKSAEEKIDYLNSRKIMYILMMLLKEMILKR
ncbi:MAG: hypothetical protein V8Q71_00780 [Bacilli bacterium]